MGKEVEFVAVGGGKGGRWNYAIMAEMVEKKVKETISNNLEEAKRIAASTAKSAKVKLHFKKDLIQKIAESGKSGKQPSYGAQLFRVKEAIRQHLGFKTRRDGEEIVITLSPSDVQRYLNEIEESMEEE